MDYFPECFLEYIFQSVYYIDALVLYIMFPAFTYIVQAVVGLLRKSESINQMLRVLPMFVRVEYLQSS